MAETADRTMSPVPDMEKKAKKVKVKAKKKSKVSSGEAKDKVISKKVKAKRKLESVDDSSKKKRKLKSKSKSSEEGAVVKEKTKVTKKKKRPREDEKPEPLQKSEPDAEAEPTSTKKKKAKSKIDKTDKVESEAKESSNPLLKGAKPLVELKESFKLSSESVRALEKRGISSLFEIQVKTFPLIRAGKDVIGRARTGMGKTLAFCLPVVETIISNGSRNRKGRGPAVIVLAPTRELAKQVSREFEDTAPQLSTTTVYGGVPLSAQSRSMYLGTDIVVGTPGRILDHIDRGNLKLGEVNHLILDEADQMLDMGFKDEMDKVFDSVSEHKEKQGSEKTYQVLLFSATLPSWVSEVAAKKMKNPEKIDLVGDMESASKDVEHLCLQCPWHARGPIISDLIKVYASGGGRAIVFCSTKKECNELAVNEALSSQAKVIHGDIAQTHREATLQGFRTGRFPVLIATDVAARGLDIKGVELVINSEPPSTNFSGRADVDTYVHRSGRTGRAGKKGVCVTLFKFNQVDLIRTIERATSNTLKRIGAPQSADLLKAAANACAEGLAKVDEKVLTQFQECTANLIKEMGAEKALSAALATITGFDSVKSLQPRSLMSSQEGYVTVQFKHTEQLFSLGYVWGALRSTLPADAVEGVKGMVMTADSKGAVFDLPAGSLEELEELIASGNERKFSICAELPEIKENPNSRFSNSRGRDRGRGGWSQGRTGNGFRSGRGRGRGRGGRGRGSRFGGGYRR